MIQSLCKLGAELIHTYSQKDKSVPCLALGIMCLLRIKNVLALIWGGGDKERVFTVTFSLLPTAKPIILPQPHLARIESFI